MTFWPFFTRKPRQASPRPSLASLRDRMQFLRQEYDTAVLTRRKRSDIARAMTATTNEILRMELGR